MYNKIALFGLALLLFACGTSKTIQNDLAEVTPIETKIDLSAVIDDKAPVTINPGRFTNDTIIYRMPRVIQGTYSVSDFGLFIDDFRAIDYQGNTLESSKIDSNSWLITNAAQLDKITYLVNDTFDVERSEKYPRLFSPQGTNISPENYVLNLHGFIGYFDQLKNAQYKLEVKASSSFDRSSALQQIGTTTSPDGTLMTTSYYAPRYFDITDNPMMYGKLDVEEFNVGDIKIVLSVYSPNNKHTAASLKETVYKMMEAQKAYLGDINTTARYDIFLFLSDGSVGAPTGFGALEHHTSTVTVLRESSTKESLAESVVDVVAHEFFHIVTPLTVHSEDVHYFDYNNPTFSKHLWMYEGVTEYFAQHFQVYEGLKTPEAFYKEIDKKIKYSMYFNDAMSFTEMSENILEKPYEDNYQNVYEKGALIGMCIDILMREESKGQRSILSLMKELSAKYGINKPFNDDDLIREISAMTYPTVSLFLENHVVGNLPINYEFYFQKVGLDFEKTIVESNYIQNTQGFIFSGDPEKGTLFFTKGVEDNSFWVEQGVLANDILKSINGTIVTIENARSLLGSMYRWKEGDQIEVVLDRNGEEITIKTALKPTYSTQKILVESKNATQDQIKIRNAWLNRP